MAVESSDGECNQAAKGSCCSVEGTEEMDVLISLSNLRKLFQIQIMLFCFGTTFPAFSQTANQFDLICSGTYTFSAHRDSPNRASLHFSVDLERKVYLERKGMFSSEMKYGESHLRRLAAVSAGYIELDSCNIEGKPHSCRRISRTTGELTVVDIVLRNGQLDGGIAGRFHCNPAPFTPFNALDPRPKRF